MPNVRAADRMKRKHNETGVMKLNRNEFIMAFAFTLDFLEMKFRESTADHNKRTGLIAAQIGRAMGLTDEDVFDLSAYAMLHDNGITHECYNVLSEDGARKLDCTASHCVIGERNLMAFPFLQVRENTIKYHHEAFDGSGPLGISGDDIPLFAQIIALSEPLEVAYSSGVGMNEIISGIVGESGRKYSPKLVEVFQSVAETVSFWLSLEQRFLDTEIKRHIPTYSIVAGCAQ